MSLVNDVLIEAERRHKGSRRARGVALEGLVPTRRNTSPRERQRAGLVALLFVLGLATGRRRDHRRARSSRSRSRRARDCSAPIRSRAWPSPRPPAVAAQGDRNAPGIRRRGPRDPAPQRLCRARRDRTGSAESGGDATPCTRVESISVERTPTATRLRLVTDRVTPHRIEHDAAGARLDIVLTSSSLVESNAPLELLDTPIRSIDRARRVSRTFASPSSSTRRFESRVGGSSCPCGAALVVDLQATPTIHSGRPRARRFEALDGLDGLDLVEPEIVQRRADLESVDQVISPPLGNPAELRIERSRQDRVRADRAALRDQVEQTLDAARRARAEKRFDDADGLYAEVVLLAPSDRLALVEWAELLEEEGRPRQGHRPRRERSDAGPPRRDAPARPCPTPG